MRMDGEGFGVALRGGGDPGCPPLLSLWPVWKNLSTIDLSLHCSQAHQTVTGDFISLVLGGIPISNETGIRLTPCAPATLAFKSSCLRALSRLFSLPRMYSISRPCHPENSYPCFSLQLKSCFWGGCSCLQTISAPLPRAHLHVAFATCFTVLNCELGVVEAELREGRWCLFCSPPVCLAHTWQKVRGNECCSYYLGFSGGSAVKQQPADAGDPGSIPGLERPPGGGNGNPRQYSWGIPWTGEAGGLQSMGWERVRHNLAAKQQLLLRACWDASCGCFQGQSDCFPWDISVPQSHFTFFLIDIERNVSCQQEWKFLFIVHCI